MSSESDRIAEALFIASQEELRHARVIVMAPLFSKRSYLVLACLATVFGWGLFFGAAMHASLYTQSHAMRGWEWLPGFAIVPVALVALCLLPDTPYVFMLFGDNRASYEREINTRLGWVVFFVGGGLIAGSMLTYVEWIAPPPQLKPIAPTPTPSAEPMAKLHVSPSPSPAPREWVATPRDTTVGYMLLTHYALLSVSLLLFWKYAVTPPPRGPLDPAPEDDVGLVA